MRALITGITGQDGSYLAELLLDKGYEVYGTIRRSSTDSTSRIKHIKNDIKLVEMDLADSSSIDRSIRESEPDEIYNLAAQSFVPLSWSHPVYTSDVTGLGVMRMLDSILNINKKIKFYQASSSEMFGRVREIPQNELTPFYPRSPYGAAKAYGHYITVNYRESYGIHASSGILFNHESERRGIEFVTRKISDGVAKIHLGISKELRLGNLDSKRDWGHAIDSVRAMWMMLQQEKPDDYVISTGETHSIRDFCNEAFSFVGLNYEDYVVLDPKFIRPSEVDILIGDSSKAKRTLGWEPKIGFEQLVRMMVDEDMLRLKNGG